MQFPGSNFVGQGFGLTFERDADGWMHASKIFDEQYQGPPTVVHGGALMSAIDEAMTASVFEHDMPAFTVNMNVDFRKTVHIGMMVTIRARVTRIDGRKLFMEGQVLLADGMIACEATALFIAMASFLG